MQIDHSDTFFDIAIIGGGIAGAGVARDAALRGFSVALLEKGSFGSGTSGKSSKLIHGGIGYLELFRNELIHGRTSEALKNLRFVFSSLRESRILRKIAPDLVEPLPLIIPIYRHSSRKPIVVYLGVTLYFLLGLLSGTIRFPKLFFGKRSIVRALPGLRSDGLCGGVRVWDHRTDDAGLVRATIASAARNGAQCFENAEVTSYEYDSFGQRYAVSAWMPDGDIHRFFSKKLVNASGPWIDKVRALKGEKEIPYLAPIAGSHIEVQKFLPTSVILQAKDGRIFFVINHGDKARVGTTEWHCPDPDRVRVPEEDIVYLLESLSRYFLTKNFTRQDILSQDAAIRPLPASDVSRDPNAISREHDIRVDPQGMMHLLGVKLTDHRRTAEEAVNRLARDLQKPGLKPRSLTASTPL